jgi:hypothetical protein
MQTYRRASIQPLPKIHFTSEYTMGLTLRQAQRIAQRPAVL